MPFYHALTAPGSVSEAERHAFAGDVVEVHCGVTGAPRSFVHVLFTEDVAGHLAPGQACSIRGTIRSGRNDDQKSRIVTGLRRAFAGRASVDEAAVAVELTDIEPSFTMEGGALLPEPGSPEEQAWKTFDEPGAST